MLDILFPAGIPPTCHEVLEAFEARIKLIEGWHDNQSAGAAQGRYLPEIRDFLYPFNGVITHHTRTYGPPWGPNNAWREWTDQAYRMGAQILIEEAETKDAPWVRLWIGNADETPGITPPELVALREWLDENPDGGQIPKYLLDAINRKDPALKRKPRREWFTTPDGLPHYGALPEELRFAHNAVQVIPRLIPALKKLLEVSIATLEQAINQQPEDITRARSEGAFESVESGIAETPAVETQIPPKRHTASPRHVSDEG